MSKITLDVNTFKLLSSDTRLEILRALDKRKMTLQELTTITDMQKATLHEHLTKLAEAELVKRQERGGHKWVYYDLSWKAKCLLHPEMGRIAVMIASTFFVFIVGIVSFISMISTMMPMAMEETIRNEQVDDVLLYAGEKTMETPLPYVPVLAFTLFAILCVLTIWRIHANKKTRL